MVIFEQPFPTILVITSLFSLLIGQQ